MSCPASAWDFQVRGKQMSESGRQKIRTTPGKKKQFSDVLDVFPCQMGLTC